MTDKGVDNRWQPSRLTPTISESEWPVRLKRPSGFLSPESGDEPAILAEGSLKVELCDEFEPLEVSVCNILTIRSLVL